MPSPDATPYVDLTLFDKDAQDVFEAALVNLQSYLPEWQPREGHTEVMLMESLGLEVEEAVFAINRTPGAIMEVLLRLYGVNRDGGTPPTTSLTFTTSDDVGHTIPAGTRASLTVTGLDDPLVFATDAAAVIPAGSLSVTVSATGDQNTTAANGTVSGTALDLLDSVVFVERVELGAAIVGGAEAEDDTAWFDRGAQRFSRLVETLVQPQHFVAAALEQTNVTRAYAVDNYDPAVGPNPGDNAGHVTVAVYGAGGVLSAADKDSLATLMDSQAQANLAVHVIDPTITLVDVTATLVALPGYSATQVHDAAVAALDAYLSPAQWPWTGSVYRFELVALLDSVEGVDRVSDLSIPAADQTLTGVAPLVDLGTATITVTVP